MFVSDTPLQVIPNPYLTLDQFGRPSGATRLDPDREVSAGQRRYIGARLASAQILAERKNDDKDSGLAPTLQANRWVFRTDKPVGIPDTTYHRDRLRDGSLFAWDEGTHRRAFSEPNDPPFTPPAERLARAREAVLADWRVHHDGKDPAFVAEEAEAAKKAEAAPPKPGLVKLEAPVTAAPSTPRAEPEPPAEEATTHEGAPASSPTP